MCGVVEFASLRGVRGRRLLGTTGADAGSRSGPYRAIAMAHSKDIITRASW